MTLPAVLFTDIVYSRKQLKFIAEGTMQDGLSVEPIKVSWVTFRLFHYHHIQMPDLSQVTLPASTLLKVVTGKTEVAWSANVHII